MAVPCSDLIRVPAMTVGHAWVTLQCDGHELFVFSAEKSSNTKKRHVFCTLRQEDDPTRILVYGGCHAVVISDLLDRFAESAVVCEPLVNFQLIASGKPFDFAHAAEFDAILYSPIRNKDDYNTQALEEFCRERGIPAVCFPWLEWHGTFPVADKAHFLGFNEWIYRPEHFFAPDARPDAARARLDPAVIHACFDMTTECLQRHEEQNRVDLGIREFVLDQFRDTQMFQTPDHPTLFLYRHVIRRIASRLGLSLSAAFEDPMPEPQQDVRLAILPEVVEALGLRYEQPLCRDHCRFGVAEVPVDDYLRLLHLGRPLARFTARHDCYAKREAVHADELGSAAKIHLPADTQVIGQLVGANDTNWHHEVRLHVARGSVMARIFDPAEPTYHLYAGDFTIDWLP